MASEPHAALRAEAFRRCETIGMQESEAIATVEEAGFVVRVYGTGKAQHHTMEFRPTRINLTVDHGSVTDAHIG